MNRDEGSLASTTSLLQMVVHLCTGLLEHRHLHVVTQPHHKPVKYARHKYTPYPQRFAEVHSAPKSVVRRTPKHVYKRACDHDSGGDDVHLPSLPRRTSGSFNDGCWPSSHAGSILCADCADYATSTLAGHTPRCLRINGP